MPSSWRGDRRRRPRQHHRQRAPCRSCSDCTLAGARTWPDLKSITHLRRDGFVVGFNVVAMTFWPIPYEHGPNGFEIVGRYIAQTIQMERFIDLILLNQQLVTTDWLVGKPLADKIKKVRSVVDNLDLDLSAWNDLPDLMKKVADNRNAFAHRMFERGDMPTHYGQGLPYERLSDDELHEQEREAFVASEVCRQLLERLTLAPLNPGKHFRRSDPDWAEVQSRHAVARGRQSASPSG